MYQKNLFSSDGERLYLTKEERSLFEAAALKQDRETMSLALVMLYTGCRASEALNLRYKHIDFSENRIVFESLKKRKKGIFRSVPVPPTLIERLNLVHGIKESKAENTLIWNMGRMTQWRRISDIMKEAKIKGKKASPKGLRHSFGIHAVLSGVPITKIQKWLGHSHISTTAIYTDAVGKEEEELAKRMW